MSIIRIISCADQETRETLYIQETLQQESAEICIASGKIGKEDMENKLPISRTEHQNTKVLGFFIK